MDDQLIQEKYEFLLSLFPICPQCKKLSEIELLYFNVSQIKVVIRCRNKCLNNVYTLYDYLLFLYRYRPKHKGCFMHTFGISTLFCNQCKLWLCKNCANDDRKRNHFVTFLPVEDFVTFLPIEGNSTTSDHTVDDNIEMSIVKKVDNIKKALTIITAYLDNNKDNFKNFENISFSLINITLIIFYNYKLSKKSNLLNPTFISNYKNNIIFTPLTEIFEILRIQRTKSYSGLDAAINNLLNGINKINNLIIKPKMILQQKQINTNNKNNIRAFCLIDPTKREIAFSSYKTVFITESSSAEPKIIGTQKNAITSLIYNNSNIISCGKENKIYVFCLKSNKTSTLSGHQSEVYKIINLKDGKIASCSEDKTIKIWNVVKKKCVGTLMGHSVGVYEIYQLKNGSLISGSFDRKIRIWNTETCQTVSVLDFIDLSATRIRELWNNNVLIGLEYYNPICINLDSFEQKKPLEDEADVKKIFANYNDKGIVFGGQGSVSLYNQSFKRLDEVKVSGAVIDIILEGNDAFILTDKSCIYQLSMSEEVFQ